jgi:hypothetical protein
MPTPSAPSYSREPIASLASLARALGVTETELAAVRAGAPRSYRRQEQLKRDGGVRITYSLDPPLKEMQRRILHRLLRHVVLPNYLQGSRPGKSYLDNVQLHCGAQTLFGEDAENFFPSIRRHHVRSIFQGLMRFSPDVAECLTDLCVFEDAVPQGAHTSADLANLVLWRVEPALVAKFEARGLTYSRFVDDMYVSALRPLTTDAKTWVVRQLHRLLALEGLRIKRKKHELAGTGQAMRVHRIGINAQRPSLPKVERSKLRAAVYVLESEARTAGAADLAASIKRLRGRIARLKVMHPTEYARLSSRMNRCAMGAAARSHQRPRAMT